MKKLDYLITGSGILTMFFLTMFTNEIKTWIMNDYKLIMFFVGFLLTIIGIIAIWVRYIFKQEFTEKYGVLEKAKKDLEISVLDSSNAITDLLHINHAIALNMINTSNQPKEEVAKILMSYYESTGINIPQWEKYKISPELITELKKQFHENKLKGISNR